MRSKFLLLLMIVLLLPLQLTHAETSGRTLVVRSGSECITGDLYFDLPSEAVASASPGDRILICPGTYHDNVKIETSDLIIQGVGDPSEVRIEALNTTQHVIELRNVRNVTVQNLTVSGAIGSQIAGMYVQLSSESVIENVIATGNYFGVDVVSSSNITMRNVLSENNTNVGINLEGTVISTLTSSYTRGNRIGVLLLFSTDLRLENVSATGNSEGGFLIKYSQNNTFSGLEASQNGWYGIYLQDSDGNSISDSVAWNNTASGSDGYGIYVYLRSDNNTIEGVIVRDNVYGVAFVSSSSGNVLLNSTIENNTISGVYIENSDENSAEARVTGSMYGIWIQDGNGNHIGGEVWGCRWGILISGLTGSSNNVVNGAAVHDNSYSGIVVEGNDSRGNVISRISSYNNTLLGVDLAGDYVTLNDGQVSEGPNDFMDYPVIEWAAVYGDRLIVKGYLNTEGAGSGASTFNGALVEIYQSDNDPSGYGEGLRYLGSLTAVDGEFLGWIDLPPELTGQVINITGLATLLPHGTSEFGPTVMAPVVSTNLTISKSVNPSTVTPNSTAEVLLLIRNYGNGTAYNVTVTDQLPDGMVYQNGTARVDGDLVEPEIEGNNLSWIVNVPADSEVIIGFNVTVTAQAGATLENLAVFEGDGSSGNDTDDVVVISPPVIEASKTASPQVVDMNGTVDYRITLTNTGGMSALLIVEDAIPSGMEYVNGSFLSNISVSGPLIFDGKIKYNLTLNPRETASISYSLKALTDGTKKNKLYVNGSFIASASVVVRDPPLEPGDDTEPSGTPTGPSTSTRRTPPPCGWLPPNYGGTSSSASEEDEEEPVNYKLDSPPIVLVSLGSLNVKVPSSQTSSGSRSSGSSTGTGEQSIAGVAASSGVTGLPMVVVEIMATPTQAETGTPITFIVRVSNIGDGPTKDLTLTVDLSSGLDYVKGSSMVGGLSREPENDNNKLSWSIGSLDQGKAIEVNFRAELLATSGNFNVVATAGSSSDSVLISVKPRNKPTPPSPPPPAPAVVELKASASSLSDRAKVIITVSSPTGAKGVKVIVTLDGSLRYIPGSAEIGNLPAKTDVSGSTLKWVVSISKGGTAVITFEVEPADEEVTDGTVRVFLPNFGKSVGVKVKFEPKQRGVAPPPSFHIQLPALPLIPWWVLLLPITLIPVIFAYRRKSKREVVMDYQALKWAVRRGILEDILEDSEIYIPMETFNKLSKDYELMSVVEKYIVDRAIKVERAPKRWIIIEGVDSELSAVLGLADKKRAPVYIGEEELLKELKKRGFRVRLIKEATPPIVRKDFP